jgi:hypothetical protein
MKDIVIEYSLLFGFHTFWLDFAPKKMLIQGQEGHKNSLPSDDYTVSATLRPQLISQIFPWIAWFQPSPTHLCSMGTLKCYTDCMENCQSKDASKYGHKRNCNAMLDNPHGDNLVVVHEIAWLTKKQNINWKGKGQGKVNVVPTSSSVATQFQLPGSQ